MVDRDETDDLGGTEWLAPSEAARRLGVSAQRVRQLAASGELPHRRTPLGRLFRADVIRALAAARAARMTPD